MRPDPFVRLLQTLLSSKRSGSSRRLVVLVVGLLLAYVLVKPTLEDRLGWDLPELFPPDSTTTSDPPARSTRRPAASTTQRPADGRLGSRGRAVDSPGFCRTAIGCRGPRDGDGGEKPAG